MLCATCEARLCGRTALCPEQISSRDEASADAWVVDRWGRMHALSPSRTIVGRQPGDGGLAIADPSVSRRHARLERDGDGWLVVDLESTNGTLVAGTRVIGSAPLESGAAVTFGDVAFFFTTRGDVSLRSVAVASNTERPSAFDPDEDRDETFCGLRSMAISLSAPSGGGGGVLDVAGTRVQLTLAQFELFRLLVDRMVAEPDREERVRGFIRSSELLASLSWDTPRPDDANLKQLVRRLRRTLERRAVADIIESRHGFGYRLRVVPRMR